MNGQKIIVTAARTAMASYQSGFADLTAAQPGAATVRAVDIR